MTWLERGIMRALFGVLLATCAWLWQGSAEASVGEPTRVLIINSFSGENGPFNNYAAHFRAELAKSATTPVAFYEASLDGARFDPASDTETFVRFLKERYADHVPDLVVPLGPPAARFYAQNRSRLFPDTPMLVGGAEQRMMRSIPLGPSDGSSSLSLDITLVLANILQLLPETQRILVVIGDSQIERYWVEVMRREYKQFEGRVAIEYLNKLSLDNIEAVVAALPAGSAILYPQMHVDGAGASRHQDDTLARLHAAATAPIFGLYASQIGKGIVGGPLMSEQLAATRLANVARVILAGDIKEAFNAEPYTLLSPEYDWRELQRWKIPESRLPAQGVVLFRQPTIWQQYKLIMIAGLAIVLLQSALLAGLLLQRVRRRRAEREALLLSGRILTAHEEERGRLARELHDDLTPRLARLAVDAARMQSTSSHTSGDLSMHDELVRLSEDVHDLSYRLHPTILEDLGLPDALRAACTRCASGQQFKVDLNVNGVPKQLPREVSVCLYRIAQEALRNVACHAHATSVQVSLALKDGGLQLMVVDDGAGFDQLEPPRKPSLGHASMRERVRQVGGRLRVLSAVGEGTSVIAWVPLHAGVD